MPMPNVAYYFTYRGRISRSEFWIRFQLPLFVFTLLSLALFQIEYPNFYSMVLATPAGHVTDIEAIMPPVTNPVLRVLNILQTIVQLPVFFIVLFANIRRLHDRDRSGWFQLIGIIPLIGPIWLMIEIFFLKGTDGPNRFGPDPVAKTA